MAEPHKVLIFDIETAPMLSFIWRMYKENVGISQLVENSFMLTWAARWRGEKKIMTDRLKQKELRAHDDARLTQGIADLMREADTVVAHYGDKFDIPVVNSRVAFHRQEPLGKVRSVDTKKLSSNDLRLPSNKLDYLGEFFLGERKMKVDFELWRAVYMGDIKELKRMQKYNVRDVELLSDVFEEMLPYTTRVPRLWRATEDREIACSYCGGTHLQRRGYYETQASVFVRYQCMECTKYFKNYSSEKDKRFGVHPL